MADDDLDGAHDDLDGAHDDVDGAHDDVDGAHDNSERAYDIKGAYDIEGAYHVNPVDKEPPDFNLDNYDRDDLLAVFNLTDDPTPFQIKDAAHNLLVAKRRNLPLRAFFTGARDKLLKLLKHTNLLEDVAASNHVDSIWHTSQFPGETDGDRAKKIETTFFADGGHFPLKIDSDTYAAANSKGPRTTSTRLVSVDSQFRAHILPYAKNPLLQAFNTRFSFNLASPINNAVSLTLYSYRLPTTWYTFTQNRGNTFLRYNGNILKIGDGNYTLPQLVTAINSAAAAQVATTGLILTGPDPITGKVTFTNTNSLLQSAELVFFVQANVANAYACGEQLLGDLQSVSINATLGWLLGFRPTPDLVTGDAHLSLAYNVPVTADVVPQIGGSSSFTLSIEDYNNQRLTGGLTSITVTRSLASLGVVDYNKTPALLCKLRGGNKTQQQVFAINAVLADNTRTNVSSFGNRAIGPNPSAAFAVIPLADTATLRLTGSPLVRLGADVQLFKRSYAQPFRLERLTVSLTDEFGNLVDLNDADWSFCLMAEAYVN